MSDLHKKYGENQENANKEKIEFLTNTMFTEPLHADWNKWKQFGMMHETEVHLGITAEFYKELFASRDEQYNLHRMGVMLSAMERRTLAEWTMIYGPSAIEAYFAFKAEVERITLLFNPIVDTKQKALDEKVQALNRIATPNKTFQA